MPRHTHPKPKAKHSRENTRYQRERMVAKRWQQIKDRYGYWWGDDLHPHDVAYVVEVRQAHYDEYMRMGANVSWTWVTANGKRLNMAAEWGMPEPPFPHIDRAMGVMGWPFNMEPGLMHSEQIHIGCNRGRKHCGGCGWKERPRARENREWRRDWDLV